LFPIGSVVGAGELSENVSVCPQFFVVFVAEMVVFLKIVSWFGSFEVYKSMFPCQLIYVGLNL